MTYFGNVAIVTSSITLNANSSRVSKYTAGSSFTADRMGFYMSGVGPTEKFRLGIYSDSSGPATLLGQTDEIYGSAIAAQRGWFQAPLASTVSISGSTAYWLAVITDGTLTCRTTLGSNGVGKTASDTFSDGFASTYGTPTNDTQKIHIFAADATPFIDHTGLSVGGAPLETSGGVKIAVIKVGTYLAVYRNSDTYPVPVSIITQSTTTGGDIAALDAKLDSSDNLHIAVAGSTEATRDVAYNILSDVDGSPSWGTWEEALNYTQQAPTNPGVAIDIDSNDKPHIHAVDNVKQGGSNQDNTYYTEKTGASWASPTQIGFRDTKTDSYNSPSISLRNSDYIEVMYNFVTDGDVAYKTYTTSWSSESVYADGGTTIQPPAITIDTSNTVRRYHIHYQNYVREDNTNTGVSSHSTNKSYGAHVDGTDRRVIFIDTSNNINFIENTGSGWSTYSAIKTGTYTYVVVGYSFRNLNNTTTIDYLCDDGTFIYWDEYSPSGGTKDGTASITAKATVTPLAEATKSGAGTITAKATVTAQAEATKSATGALNATATITATGQIVKSGAATVTAAATITAAAETVLQRTAAIIATATVTAQAEATKSATGAISAQATITAVASLIKSATASLTAKATVTAAGTSGATYKDGTAAITANASVTAQAQAVISATASILNYGSVTATGSLIKSATASINAKATVTSVGQLVANASASVKASAVVVAAAEATKSANATIIAQAIITAAGTGNKNGTAAITASASVTAQAEATKSATASITAKANTNATAQLVKSATATIQVQAAISAQGQHVYNAQAAITATSLISSYGTRITHRTATITAAATITAVGLSQRPDAPQHFYTQSVAARGWTLVNKRRSTGAATMQHNATPTTMQRGADKTAKTRSVIVTSLNLDN